MLRILSFSDRERASPPSTEISVLTLVVKKCAMKFSGVSILKNRRENLKSNIVPVLEYYALYSLLFPAVIIPFWPFIAILWFTYAIFLIAVKRAFRDMLVG